MRKPACTDLSNPASRAGAARYRILDTPRTPDIDARNGLPAIGDLPTEQEDDVNLPSDIIELLTTYIRVEMREIEPPQGYDPRRIYDLHSRATKHPAEFLAAVATVVIPASGEAARGGARLVWELLSVNLFDTDPNAQAMLNAGVKWAREHNHPLVPYEAERPIRRAT
jgi:hypothetical protein